MLNVTLCFQTARNDGGMPEWPNGPVLKTSGQGETPGPRGLQRLKGNRRYLDYGSGLRADQHRAIGREVAAVPHSHFGRFVATAVATADLSLFSAARMVRGETPRRAQRMGPHETRAALDTVPEVL